MPGFTCVNQPHYRHLQPTSGNKNPMISPSSLDRAPSRTRSTNSYMRHDPTHSPFSAPKEPKAMRKKSPKVVLPVNAQHSKSYHSDLAPEFNSSHKTRAVTPPQEHDNNSEDAPPDHPHDPKTPNHTYKGDKAPSPNARRKQPVRNVKLMASIEQSAKKAVFDSDTSGRDSITDSSFIGTMTPSSTCQSYRSKSGAHVIPVQRCRHARDDIWTPSSTRSDKPGFDESPDLSQGFSPSRHHVAEGRRCQALKSEPRDSQDSSRQNHDIIIRTSPSPFMCDADKQQRRLERHGVVEQNSFDYATARYEFAKRELLQEIRRKKGKSVDCRDDRQAYCLSEGNKKRKYDTKTMTGPRGEEKKMHKKVKCDLSTDDFDSKAVGNAEAISSEDQIAPAQSFRDEKAVLVGKPLDDVSRKQTRAIENGKLQAEMQISKAVIKADSIISVSSTSEGHLKAKAPARKVHESPSTHSSRQNASSSSTTGSRKAQASRPWEHSRARREISMPIIVHECTCTSLPEYFTQPRLTEPTLSSWGAGKAEFLAHVGQISQCRGHRERLIKYCRLILELEARAEERQVRSRKKLSGDDGITYEINFAQSCLSSGQSAAASSGLHSASFAPHLPGGSLYPTAFPDKTDDRWRKQSSIEPTRFYGSPYRFHREGDTPHSLPERNERIMTATTAAGTYSTSPRLLSLNELVNNTRPRISSPLASREEKWNTLDDAPDTPDRNIETSKRSAADVNDSILTEPNSLPLGGKTKKRTKARNHPAPNNAIKALSSTPDTSADPQIMTPPDSSPSGARASLRQKSSDPQLGHDYSVSNDWWPWEDDDDPIFPPSTPSSPRRSIRAPTSKRHRSKGPSAAREDIDSVSSQFKTLAQRPSDAKGHDRSFEIRRKRHQSLPAQLRGDGNLTGEPPTTPPIRTQPNQDRVLQLEMIDRMKNIESLLKERRVAPSTQQTQYQATATPPNARITAPTHHNEAAATQRRRKKEKTRAERKATDRPEIPRDVPMDLRRSDPFLLKVGKIVNPYERHVEAPYAFAWSGRLYAEYNRLLTEKDEHGGLVFTKEEIRRLTK